MPQAGLGPLIALPQARGGQTRGGLAALTAAACFGFSAPLSKLVLATLDPWLMAGLLYLSAGLGLTLLRAVRGDAFTPIAAADRPWLLGSILVGGLIAPAALMLGVARGDGAISALLLNTETPFTVAIAWGFFGERLGGRAAAGVAAVLIGAAALSWPGSVPGASGAVFPALAVITACACWGLDNSLTCRIRVAAASQIAAIKGWAAGLINCVLALAFGAQIPAWESVAAAGVIGFIAYGLSLVLFVHALRSLGAARTGGLFATAPFIGALAAWPVLGDAPTPLLLAIGGVMALGVALILRDGPPAAG